MIDQKSIAVLPFHNLNKNSDELYLIDGIADEIINALSRIEGLKVTSRRSSFSFRDSNLDIRKIGNALHVATILEGSIRIIGKRIRISTQLVKTDTGFQIWSERFDREMDDIFELQDEISLCIAERIRENFGHLEIQDQLIISGTKSIKAYDFYLKGNHKLLQQNQSSLQEALYAFKESIRLDPDFSMPYLGIAQCYIYLSNWGHFDQIKGMFMAFRFISKLSQDYDHLPEYHFTKGLFHFYGKWDFKTAERFLLKSLSLNPNFSDALHVLANLYNANGNFKKASSLLAKAFLLNPTSPKHHFTKAMNHYLNNNVDLTLDSLNESLKVEPDWSMALQLKLFCHLLKRDQQLFHETLTKFNSHETKLYHLLWKTYHQEVIDVSKLENTIIKLYCLVNQKQLDEALQILREGVELKQAPFIAFMFDPLLKPLNQLKGFKELKKAYQLSPVKMNLKEEGVKPKVSPLGEREIKRYLESLKIVLEDGKFYLNSDATLSQLAQEIELHPNKLSWLLNEIKAKNFNDFINEYRIKAFQKMALSEKGKKLTLLALAYESGFNSKSVFNDSFKKLTGQTPKQWVKANQ